LLLDPAKQYAPALVHFMNEKLLTSEERALLQEEKTNSEKGRQRNIKKGLTIVLVSVTVVLLTSLIDRSDLSQEINRLLGALRAISVSTAILGILSLHYWLRTAKKEIDKLNDDITNGKKISGRFKIIGYNFFSQEVKLDNGVSIDRYDVGAGWKKGDVFDVEYLPTSLYVFKCDKNAGDR
jgi:hypothetical protein